MGFHRFVDPSYNLGGGSFPGTLYGEAYDRVNVISGGVGTGGSAFADNAKVGGPNVGTYWHAFGEDATSNYFNRGMKALNENTDLLDDLLHRDIAVPARTATVASSGQTSVALVGEIWLDDNPATPLDDLFSVLDQYDREILDTTTGTQVVVSSISAGGAVGDGFSPVGGVTLQFNIAITALMATSWRVYYGERSCLAVLPQDALVKIKVRSAEEVDADVENTIKKIKWNLSSSNTWLTDPLKNLYNVAYSGLDDLYRLTTIISTSMPSWYPRPRTLNTDGAGGWFSKDNFAMAGRAAVTGASVVGTLGYTEYALGAVWHSIAADSFSTADNTHRISASSGFVHFGRAGRSWNDLTDVGTNKSVGLFGLGSFSRRSNLSAASGNNRTMLLEGSVFTAGDGDPDYLAAPASNWFSHATYGTAIQLGLDVLVFVDASGHYWNLVVTAFDDDTHVFVRCVDGTSPAWGGATSLTLVAWLAPTFINTDNAPAFENLRYPNAYAALMKGNGNVMSALPARYSSVAQIQTPALSCWGSDESHSSPAMVWGGHDALDSGVLNTRGSLLSDGTIYTESLPALSTDAILHLKNMSPLHWIVEIIKSEHTGIAGKMRIIDEPLLGWGFTHNAYWDNDLGDWYRDVIGNVAARFVMFADGTFKSYTAPAGASAITWTEKNNLGYNIVEWPKDHHSSAGTSFDSETTGTRNLQVSAADVELTTAAYPIGTAIYEAEAHFVINPGGNTVNVWIDSYYSGADHVVLGSKQQFTGSTDIHVALRGKGSIGTVSVALHIRFQIVAASGTTHFLGDLYFDAKVYRE
jgi:hypothetical protein